MTSGATLQPGPAPLRRDGTAERLVRAASFLGGDVGARFLAFAVLIAGARVLGPAEFGRFALVLAVVSICLLVADFGLTPLTMRRLSEETAPRRETFWSAVGVNVALAGLVYAALLAGFQALADHFLPLVALYGLVLFLHAVATSAEALLFASDRAGRVGANRLAGNVVLAGSAALALATDPAAGSLLFAFFLGSVAKLALGLAAGRGAIGCPAFDPLVARSLLRAAVPFALAAIVSFLYFRLDVVLLGALASDESVGQYAAAYRFVDGLLLVPIAVAYTFFPGWTRSSSGPRHTLLLLKLLAALGVLAALVTWSSGPHVAELVLGSEFEGAGRALRILALGLPLLFVDVVAIWFAYSRGREWSVIAISLAALAANVTLNSILIPAYDFTGAAVATVVTEGVNFAGYAVLFRGLIRSRLRAVLASGGRIAVSGATAVAVSLLAVRGGSVSSFAASAAAGAALVATLAATGFLDSSERRELWRHRRAAGGAV